MICSFTLITAGGVKGTLRLLRIGLSMKASSCSSSSGPNSRLDGFILLENICSLEISQSVLVVSGRAGGGPQYQPSLMKSRGRRGWRRRRRRRRTGGGGPTVTNRFQGDPCSICPGWVEGRHSRLRSIFHEFKRIFAHPRIKRRVRY